MNVNPKKVLTLKNRTCYFNPDTSRIRIRVSSPYSYQYKEFKIESYESRLYWQFKYCEDHLGQTFFYTLTYNDNAIPRPYGFNCFDYEDLRDLLTGGFRKQLLRKYGTTFKYFVGAELGDGKGSRGMHNNPHYHVLFFLIDACDQRFPYKVISPKDFRHLVKLYWQGFDEDVDGFDGDGVFGFTERYNAYRYGRDNITGDFRDLRSNGDMNCWHTGRNLSLIRSVGNLVAQSSSMNTLPQTDSEYNRIFSVTSGDVDHFYLTAHFSVDAVRPMLNLNQVADLGTGDSVVPRNGNVIS